MKKHNEHSADKSPVDDLFARRLRDTALPPTEGGFERLQARMNAQHQKTPVVPIWSKPALQRYMAAAACVLLVCLFGWLYLSADQPGNSQTDGQVAAAKTAKKSQPESSAPAAERAGEVDLAKTETTTQPETGPATANSVEPTANQVAGNDVLPDAGQVRQLQQQPVDMPQPKQPVEAISEPMVAQNKPAPTTEPDRLETTPVEPRQASAPERAVASAKLAERVLTVTIAEPERLVAARQVVKSSADEGQPEGEEILSKEAKGGNFWQQVRRVKQGEIFARQDAGTEERSLLSRAYNGLKHSIDKDKPTKQ
ncbi:hypothetical protein [Spirosoma sordidisoli]|uniref:Uncharacterized protein n=1 Tax=Spirosoma sordidisoli TaxID=2502893 RepID=A0A4Q2UJM0_9BACT|nr:hypothetical protein [Spirosoma sordidisoli]RYC67781.1 hypothetical protein EQG79_24075 [Spirosoma sordidisoli]